MEINEIRDKYLKFFEKRGHKIISPSPLVLENDPTTLFTSSGMQPLVPYLLGEDHPAGKRVCDSQPSIRLEDIEEVGDNRHTTFFEMLGNWSLGDYFKKEQLPWIWEFLTVELKLPKEKLFVSVFEGDGGVPKDHESFEIWKSLGVAESRIYEYGVNKNWWSRSGVPSQMPEGEIGGPDSEVFYDFGEELGLHEASLWKNEKCHPNCDCGRFMEIGNSVFIQYKKENGKLVELPQKNVDFGGGLERIAAATNGNPDVFKIDALSEIVKSLEISLQSPYKMIKNQASLRIIADHLRAVSFLEIYGVTPSNKLQGYIMRRLIRRAALKARELTGELRDPHVFTPALESVYEVYSKNYLHLRNILPLQKLVSEEIAKFLKTLDHGLKEVEKLKEINGKIAFDLYQTYGFPLEMSIEIFEKKGQKIDKEEFKKAFFDHQEKSRSAAEGSFKGGLMDHSVETTRLHTATHLIHAALRKILGTHVTQKGSNITHERLRFDFTHTAKLTPEEILEIQKLVNEQIDRDLPVSFQVMSLDKADQIGALHFFDKKYEENVKVYTIGSEEEFFSREVCGGPHVDRLSDLSGHVKITREEAVSSGVRRIYAQIVPN